MGFDGDKYALKINCNSKKIVAQGSDVDAVDDELDCVHVLKGDKGFVGFDFGRGATLRKSSSTQSVSIFLFIYTFVSRLALVEVLFTHRKLFE